MSGSKQKQVICLVGSTGSGKSGFALELARHLNGAVINMDSRQVYLSLPIITAQPGLSERMGVPHLLYGFLPCSRKTTAGMYAGIALEAVNLCFRLGLQPILVGGTGLYINALVNGIAPIPQVGREVTGYWQMRLDRAGSRSLHAELAQVDPSYAAKISHNDSQRITRALEVWSGTGRSISWWHCQPLTRLPYPVLKLGLCMPLARLTNLLERRIDRMIEEGALREVEAALRGGAVIGNSFSSIGFSEIANCLEGKISREECKARWLASTRAYAKRQITWFKRDDDIHWLEMDAGLTYRELFEQAFVWML